MNKQLNLFQLIRPTWIPDSDVSECPICYSSFNSINRRHHCRQCGGIFCSKCCSKKTLLPQFGYVHPERVCDNCFEVACLVSAAISDVLETQIQGARGLTGLSEKDGGLTTLVNHGGLDTLIHLCYSTQKELYTTAISALENFSKIPEMQNTLVMKGALPCVFKLASNQNQSTTVLLPISRILLNLSKNGDIAERILLEGGLAVLLSLAGRPLPSLQQAGSKVVDEVVLIQANSAKAFSALASHSKNQAKIIEDKNDGLIQLYKLLSSPNELVRKYTAKSFAFLSLRNDRLKLKLLENSGSEILISVLQNQNCKFETISHICCTISNLATNKESQLKLMETPELLSSLQAANARFDDVEIKRHIARGVANFALYEENQSKLVPILPLLLKLGDSPVDDICRHVVRAIDNLLTSENPQIRIQLRELGAIELLRRIASKKMGEKEEISKRAKLTLNSLESDAVNPPAASSYFQPSPFHSHENSLSMNSSRGNSSENLVDSGKSVVRLYSNGLEEDADFLEDSELKKRD